MFEASMPHRPVTRPQAGFETLLQVLPPSVERTMRPLAPEAKTLLGPLAYTLSRSTLRAFAVK